MGLFARLTCLRTTNQAADVADVVRRVLLEHGMAEPNNSAEAERLVLVASAGDGWVWVVDRLEQPMSLAGPHDLISELNRTHAGMAIEVMIVDSDHLEQIPPDLHQARYPACLK
jgi:hypothetical protein